MARHTAKTDCIFAQKFHNEIFMVVNWYDMSLVYCITFIMPIKCQFLFIKGMHNFFLTTRLHIHMYMWCVASMQYTMGRNAFWRSIYYFEFSSHISIVSLTENWKDMLWKHTKKLKKNTPSNKISPHCAFCMHHSLFSFH